MIAAVQTLRFYNLARDAHFARVSATDGTGAEWWAIVPWESPKERREGRDRALDAIEAAMLAGRDPGEVAI